MPKKAAAKSKPASATRRKAPAAKAAVASTGMASPPAAAGPSAKGSLQAWLANCRHPLRAELDALRTIVVAAEPRLVEGVKWNAPSYAFAGDDRLTFNLSAKDRVRLIFHCGVKKRAATGRVPVDDQGLLEWAADDRGIATFRSADEVAAAKKALTQLVRGWLAATSG